MLRAAHAMRNPSVRTTEFQYSSFPPSAPPHDNDTDPIPSSTLHAFRRRVLQWNDAYISGVKLEADLKILADEHGTPAGEPKLIGGSIAIPITFDNNGSLDYGVAVFCQRGIQQLHPFGR